MVDLYRMPTGRGAPRFSPPPAQVYVNRYRHGGLGASVNETVPAEDVTSVRKLEETIPAGGFTAILSRSRFFRMLTPRPVGHGDAQAPSDNPSQGPDPADGRSQFDNMNDNFPGPISDDHAANADRGAQGLEAASVQMMARGRLKYVRRRDIVPLSGLVPVGPPRWSDAGPAPRSRMNRRYTLRPEFEQNAQTFSGIRFTVKRGAHVSTSPVRMLPPRTNRLTERDLPRSFGQTTQTLTEGGDGAA